MSTSRATRTFLATALLAVAAACGGSEDHDIATRTVELDGRTYELVAEYPSSMPRHQVDAFLLTVEVIRVEDRLAPRPAEPIMDPIPSIHIGVYPHDDEDGEEAAAYYATAPTSCEDEACAPDAPDDDVIPLDVHTKDLNPGNIGAATDPDVDPATPY